MTDVKFSNAFTRNIRLILEYDGTAYHGWQIQPALPTIQGCVQEVLQRILSEDTRLIGAGRTDAGVHATGQVAHFHTASKMTTQACQRALNALLPPDIAICEAAEVEPAFHARYDATRRVYRYTLLNRDWPSALERDHVLHQPRRLSVDQMHQMCAVLVGTHDFSSFQKTGSTRRNPVCTVDDARSWREGDKVYFQIAADSFLRGMVRAIVGSCLQWQGQADAVPRMHAVLAAKDRAAAGPSAPPQGLCLIRVEY